MEALYESEISELLNVVKDKLAKAKSLEENDSVDQDELALGDGDSLETICQELGTDITRLQQTIKQLEAQVRTISNTSSRRVMQDRVKQFKRDTKTYENDYKAINQRVNSSNLFKQSVEISEEEREHRNRMLDMNTRLDKGTASLQNSAAVMEDLESAAMDVSSQLRQNRETLESAHAKLRASGGLTNQAMSVLRNMESREYRQKAAIYFVFFLLACLFLYMFYAIIFKQKT